MALQAFRNPGDWTVCAPRLENTLLGNFDLHVGRGIVMELAKCIPNSHFWSFSRAHNRTLLDYHGGSGVFWIVQQEWG
jgi:hypothetical protein